tara:strand:- start:8096 stop:9031 length:936 start_codon:yes stop_codon:yes gene_type:complete
MIFEVKLSHIVDLHAPWQQAIKKSASIKAHESETNQTLSRVSVVLVAKGSYLEALATLVSLLPQFLVREIILVDCIQSLEFEEKIHTITREYARITVISGRVGMPLACAYNLGRRQCASRYVLFLQTPGIVSKNVISEMLTLGLDKKEPWVVGLESKGSIDPLLNLIKQPDIQYIPHSSYSGRIVSALAANCFLLPSELLIAVGPFDEQCADENVILDFSLRLHALGADLYSDKAWVSPKSVQPPWVKGPEHMNISQQLNKWDYYYRKHFSRQYKRYHIGLLALRLLIRRLLQISRKIVRAGRSKIQANKS